MPRIGFTMKLFAGKEEEYRKRHDEIWPELVELLKQQGIANYSIFLDSNTNVLFGVLEMDDPHLLDVNASKIQGSIFKGFFNIRVISDVE